MARRAHSTIHPIWIFIGILLMVGLMVGGYLFYGRESDPYRTTTELDVPAYLENSNSLRGNIYKVKGTILNSLSWSLTAGRLFSIEISSSSNTEVLPILIPIKFNEVNIQKGQRFYFKVEIDEKGILKLQDLQKV